MNKNEAHHLLNKRKQGLAVPQYLVNSALVVSGDLGMACSPYQAIGLESTGMAQGQGIRELFYPLVDWNNNRFDKPHESPI
jgi:hypothetical protein